MPAVPGLHELLISGVMNGLVRALIFIRLMGACRSNTSRKRELNISI